MSSYEGELEADTSNPQPIAPAVAPGVCSDCGCSGVPLLLCDDLATENSAPLPHNPMLQSKNRYCAQCMIGKKVRVFWPLDEQWYVGVVKEYDESSGEHLLKYPDGDTEWVKIGDTQQQMEGLPADATGSDALQSPPRILSKAPHGGALPVPSMESPDRIGRDYGPPPGYPPYPMHAYPAYGPPYPGYPGHPSNQAHMGLTPPRPGSEHVKVSGTPDGDPKKHTTASPGDGIPPPHLAYPAYPGSYPHQPPWYPPPYAQQGRASYPLPYGDPNAAPPPPYGHPMSYPPYPVPTSSGNRSATTGAQSSAPKSESLSGSATKRKSGPKTWTKEEDSTLLTLVQSMRGPMKWSVVAQNMPDRTGKQCRERYVNHLNPRLKVTDWSPAEDATVFHLYDSLGSQWAKMAKMIPGRTDNGIKNRFHNLRRQLEREDEHRMKLSKAQDFPEEIHLARLRKFPKNLTGKNDSLWDMSAGIGILAAQSVFSAGVASRDTMKKKFGPFRKAEKDGESCARCGFLVPSIHCGLEICEKTKWCESCSRIPSHLSGNILRECLNLRRSQDKDIDRIVIAWNANGIPTASAAD